MGVERSYEKGLQYQPAPDKPEGFDEQVAEICGINPKTGKPWLRFVWGMDRLEYIAGHWQPRYGDTVHEPAKYVGRPRWILEGWQSPSVYAEAEWKTLEHLLGDWPRTGVWDFIEDLQTPDGEFQALGNKALDRVRNWKYWRGIDRKRSIDELMEKKMLRWSLQQQRRKAEADKVAQEFGEDIEKLFTDGVPEKAFSLPTPGGYKRTEAGLLVEN